MLCRRDAAEEVSYFFYRHLKVIDLNGIFRNLNVCLVHSFLPFLSMPISSLGGALLPSPCEPRPGKSRREKRPVRVARWAALLRAILAWLLVMQFVITRSSN